MRRRTPLHQRLQMLNDRELLAKMGREALSLPEIEEIPKTSQAAIRMFEERYLDGTQLPADPTWASEIGDITDVNSPYVTYPMSLMSLLFKENKGENRFESMGENSFDLKPVEFDEGIQVPLAQLTTNTFAARKWLRGPELLRAAEARFVALQIASAVIDGNPACGWDQVDLFSVSHLVNPQRPDLGNFSNLEGTGTAVDNVDNITAQIEAMMGAVLDENGNRLITSPRFAIVVPYTKFQALSVLLKQDQIVKAIYNVAKTEIVAAGAQANPYAGIITPVYAPQWDGGTSGLDWLLCDLDLIEREMPPWLGARWAPGGALELRVYDEASDFFKNTGKIAISNHIWWGFGAVFPHAIRYVTGA